MSIQSQFNKEALEMLTKTRAYVLKKHESPVLNAIVLRKILNSRIPIASMTSDELNKFDEQVLEFLQF